MPRNKINQEELDELSEMGADIELEKETVEVAGLNELVSKLSEIIKTNEYLANKQHNQTREILNSIIQELSCRQTIDVAPIASAIAAMKPTVINTNRGYTFEIERNNRGLMTRVEAKPKQETIN